MFSILAPLRSSKQLTKCSQYAPSGIPKASQELLPKSSLTATVTVVTVTTVTVIVPVTTVTVTVSTHEYARGLPSAEVGHLGDLV